jgi:serine/threonine-protein kinase RsbW
MPLEASAVSEPVELTIPVQADLILLARLTAATVASRAGFDVEEVEDLRLAVDELCVSVVNGASSGRLQLTFVSSADQVEVTCVVSGAEPSDQELAPEHAERDLSVRILDALVDEHGEEVEEGQSRGWLRKRSNLHKTS